MRNRSIDEYPILSKDDIDRKRNKVKFYTKDDCKILDPRINEIYKKYDFISGVSNSDEKNHHIKPGTHFLYEIFYSTSYESDRNLELKLSYPKLGIYINSYPCDQTIIIEWAEHRRNWEWNFRMSENSFVGEEQILLNNIPLWMDSMMVYGFWDKIPTWKELKPAYEETLWYGRSTYEKRDIKLDRIINGL